MFIERVASSLHVTTYIIFTWLSAFPKCASRLTITAFVILIKERGTNVHMYTANNSIQLNSVKSVVTPCSEKKLHALHRTEIKSFTHKSYETNKVKRNTKIGCRHNCGKSSSSSKVSAALKYSFVQTGFVVCFLAICELNVNYLECTIPLKRDTI